MSRKVLIGNASDRNGPFVARAEPVIDKEGGDWRSGQAAKPVWARPWGERIKQQLGWHRLSWRACSADSAAVTLAQQKQQLRPLALRLAAGKTEAAPRVAGIEEQT